VGRAESAEDWQNRGWHPESCGYRSTGRRLRSRGRGRWFGVPGRPGNLGRPRHPALGGWSPAGRRFSSQDWRDHRRGGARFVSLGFAPLPSLVWGVCGGLRWAIHRVNRLISRCHLDASARASTRKASILVEPARAAGPSGGEHLGNPTTMRTARLRVGVEDGAVVVVDRGGPFPASRAVWPTLRTRSLAARPILLDPNSDSEDSASPDAARTADSSSAIACVDSAPTFWPPPHPSAFFAVPPPRAVARRARSSHAEATGFDAILAHRDRESLSFAPSRRDRPALRRPNQRVARRIASSHLTRVRPSRRTTTRPSAATPRSSWPRQPAWRSLLGRQLVLKFAPGPTRRVTRSESSAGETRSVSARPRCTSRRDARQPPPPVTASMLRSWRPIEPHSRS